MVKKILSKRINFLIMKSLLITVLCTIGIGAEEQGREKDIEVKDIQPEMVWELPIKGEKIINVIFDEITMTVKEAKTLGMKGLEQKKAVEMVKFQYPRVIITENGIKFLNEKGKMENNIILNRKNMEWPLYNNKWERIVPLDSDKIVIGGNKGEYPFGEDSYLYIKWIDKKGKTIKIEKGCLTTILSENGKYIVDGDLYEGYDCILYDINGNRLWIYNAEENLKGMHILHDGKVVIIEGIEEKKDKAKISLIETNGKKLWEREIIKGRNYDIFSTVDCKIIVYGDVTEFYENNSVKEDKYVLYGFDKSGRFLWEPKEYIGFNNSFHKLTVSKNANYLTGLTLWDHLWIMDINIGNVIWKYPLKGKKPNFVEISPNGKYILLEGITKLENGNAEYYSILLENRKEIKKITFPLGNYAEIERRTLRELNLPIGKFLNIKNIWRRKGNIFEIFNISDIMKEKMEK